MCPKGNEMISFGQQGNGRDMLAGFPAIHGLILYESVW